MLQEVNLSKVLFDKSSLENTLDTSFSQLNTNQTSSLSNDVSIEEFFTLYSKLFYQIPKQGITNSHEYLIQESISYAGYDQINNEIQSLLDEIQSLRTELLAANQQIVTLSTK